MITLGIDGGPGAGGSVQVPVDADGLPPAHIVLDGTRYEREHVGIDPHDLRWHYCAGR